MSKRLLSPWSLALLAALLVGGLLSILASSAPDGLEKIAADNGFLGKGTRLIEGLLPDYTIPGVSNHALATALAGFTGTLGVFAALYAIGWLLGRKAPIRRPNQ